MSEGRSTIVFWIVGVVVLVGLAALLASSANEEPLDPRSVAPDGARALVELLGDLDAEVVLGRSVPSDFEHAALLLGDTYGRADRTRVEEWVAAGGVLVVADPSSPLTPRRGGAASSAAVGCDVAALSDVRTVVGASARFRLDADDVARGAVSCFSDTVAIVPHGTGVIVSVGGAEPFLNRSIADGDNALLAVSLLAPVSGSRVVFLEPVLTIGGGERLEDLIADPVWMVLIQLAVAFVLLAWWQARRLGDPVDEPMVVQVAGAELTAARGRLYEGLRDHAAAAADLRADTRRAVGRRLGVAGDADASAFAEAAARHSGFDADAVVDLVERTPVTNDADLLAIARGLARLRSDICAPRAAASFTRPTPDGDQP